MADTPNTGLRVDPALIDAARERVGAPDVSLSVLVRAALILFAHPDLSRIEALNRAQTRPGPKPKKPAMPRDGAQVEEVQPA